MVLYGQINWVLSNLDINDPGPGEYFINVVLISSYFMIAINIVTHMMPHSKDVISQQKV